MRLFKRTPCRAVALWSAAFTFWSCATLSLAASENDTSRDEVGNVCAKLDQILAVSSTRADYRPTAIHELIRQLRASGESSASGRYEFVDKLAKNRDLVDRMVADLPSGPIGPIWSATARDKSVIDGRSAGVFTANDVLGTSIDRLCIMRFFGSAAKAAEEANDPARAIAIRRAALRHYAADPMEMATYSTRLIAAAKKRSVPLGDLLGISDSSTAKSVESLITALSEATNQGATLLPEASIQCDRVIRQFASGDVEADDLDDALDHLDALWTASAPCNTNVSYLGANLYYRLRSITALKGSPEQLAEVDQRLSRLIDSTIAQPQKRWLTEARAASPASQTGSGIAVVTDPNDPIVKGVPPQ